MTVAGVPSAGVLGEAQYAACLAAADGHDEGCSWSEDACAPLVLGTAELVSAPTTLRHCRLATPCLLVGLAGPLAAGGADAVLAPAALRGALPSGLAGRAACSTRILAAPALLQSTVSGGCVVNEAGGSRSSSGGLQAGQGDRSLQQNERPL